MHKDNFSLKTYFLTSKAVFCTKIKIYMFEKTEKIRQNCIVLQIVIVISRGVSIKNSPTHFEWDCFLLWKIVKNIENNCRYHIDPSGNEEETISLYSFLFLTHLIVIELLILVSDGGYKRLLCSRKCIGKHIEAARGRNPHKDSDHKHYHSRNSECISKIKKEIRSYILTRRLTQWEYYKAADAENEKWSNIFFNI